MVVDKLLQLGFGLLRVSGQLIWNLQRNSLCYRFWFWLTLIALIVVEVSGSVIEERRHGLVENDFTAE